MNETVTGSAPTLYKNGQFIKDDWSFLDEGIDYAGADRVLVPFDQAITWLGESKNAPALFGVLVMPDDDVAVLAPYLDRVAVIAVSFPAFSDGRGFSSARLLRERFGFKGEIRAVGNYILDQMPFLLRCGVDAFAVTSDKVRAGLERGDWPEVSHYYQPTGTDQAEPIASRPWLRRRQG